MNFIERHRKSLLSLVMLGILLIAVCIAWLITLSSSALMDEGTAVIREIRKQSLPVLLKNDPAIRCYLIKNKEGGKLGYGIDTLRSGRNGYDGAGLMHLPRVTVSEKWQLSNDAARGSYAGLSSGMDQSYTAMSLSDGKLIATVQLPTQKIRSELTVPDNFIPDGIIDLVVRVVAQRGGKAVFHALRGSQAVMQNRLYFSTVTMIPQGRDKVKVQIKAPNGEVDSFIYHLDAKGQVLDVKVDEAITMQVVGQEELFKAFPETRSLLPSEEEDQMNPQTEPGEENDIPTFDSDAVPA